MHEAMVIDQPGAESAISGAELKGERHRLGLSLADVGKAWPGGPTRRQAVAGIEALAVVSPVRARRYVDALAVAGAARVADELVDQ